MYSFVCEAPLVSEHSVLQIFPLFIPQMPAGIKSCIVQIISIFFSAWIL
jgi:hypothetical protein